LLLLLFSLWVHRTSRQDYLLLEVFTPRFRF